MAAKTVGFAIDENLRPALDAVVEHFGRGNRSEFLRVAVKDYERRLRMERLAALRDDVRQTLGDRRLSPDEVMALVKGAAAAR